MTTYVRRFERLSEVNRGGIGCIDAAYDPIIGRKVAIKVLRPELRGEKLTEEKLGEDVLELFELDRGFYLGSDLGVFFALGGTRGYSNVQPYLAIKLGLDIGDYFGLQLNLSTAYSSGNPVSAQDRPAGSASRLLRPRLHPCL